ncbi:MAG: hypothetical protein NTX64_15450, partial [Elusimicrobia bacterium]|nr:hypothetical protein [Elusimicrobiota bacterium]
MAARALVWRRRLLPALCIVLPAFAQAADAAGDAERGQPPSIHGRTSPPEDVGKPPVLALSGGSDCGSRRADFEARSTFKSRKRVWNASRIASVGSSYRLEACEAASDAFDKAAELSAGPGNRAFESASQAAFQAASACRAAFDALCSAECSGVKD